MKCFHVAEVASLPLSRMSVKVLVFFGVAAVFIIHAENQEVKLPRDDDLFCSKVECQQYASCLDCSFPDCEYGSVININCTTKQFCLQSYTITKEVDCRYCWQLPSADYDCVPVRNCSASEVRLRRTVCTVHQSVLCKGRRVFFKNVRCNWSSGYSWWKAMLLSVTLGGFGADRFYLGMWKSAIGKLFSFGGLGVWTLIDAVLIGIGYVGPADGSLYI